MSVHKTSEHAQHTIQENNAVSLKLVPVLCDENFEDNGSDIGELALQLLMELDATNSDTHEASRIDHISGYGGMRAKLLKLFEYQNMIEFDGTGPKITVSGRRSFHAALSSKAQDLRTPANSKVLPSGNDATTLLLAIMRNHFFESLGDQKTGI